MKLPIALAIVLAVLVLAIVARVVLVRKRPGDSRSSSPTPSTTSTLCSSATVSSPTLPAYSIAPPAQLPPTDGSSRSRSSPFGSLFGAIAAEFRAPAPPDFGDPSDPAYAERRLRYNIDIQRALIDAGLMLPPRQTRTRHTRHSRGEIDPARASPSAGQVEAGVAAPKSWRGRVWLWLVGTKSPEERWRTVEGELDPSLPHQGRVESELRATRERERAERHARRERRREREEARLVEEGTLGLPAYTKEKAEGEQVLSVGSGVKADGSADEVDRVRRSSGDQPV